MSNLEKVLKVINSCETLEQLEVAREYMVLAKLSFLGRVLDVRSGCCFCSHSIATFALFSRQAVLNGEHEDEGVEDYGWW